MALFLGLLMTFKEGACACGRDHRGKVKHLIIEDGALERLPDLLKEGGFHRAFVMMDRNTRVAAGDAVCSQLSASSIPYERYVFPEEGVLEPDEKSVGEASLAYTRQYDVIVSVGSGVLNDIAKVLSSVSGRPYVLALTAPSMDGIVSESSSMALGGLKVTVPTVPPWAVTADVDVLKKAPAHMIASGVGDMFAKYVSVAEWEISHIITGEYYCPRIAALMHDALDAIEKAVPLLSRGDNGAIKAVTEGLVMGGQAMAYAGCSRPASGTEHYVSHLMDMRNLAFGTSHELHGVQVAVGTLLSLRMYRYIQMIKAVDIDKADAYVASWSLPEWNQKLIRFVGPASSQMIALEEREGKYDKEKHHERVRVIAERWPEIQRVITTLPPVEKVEGMMKTLHLPLTLTELGVAPADQPMMMLATKDIRDKYIGTRLLWDIGELEPCMRYLFG